MNAKDQSFLNTPVMVIANILLKKILRTYMDQLFSLLMWISAALLNGMNDTNETD